MFVIERIWPTEKSAKANGSTYLIIRGESFPSGSLVSNPKHADSWETRPQAEIAFDKADMDPDKWRISEFDFVRSN